MSNDAEDAYLVPGFDPTSLTVPRLRNILVAHAVTYPSNAPKAQLVALFRAHVEPQAPALRAERAHVQPSDKGIENADVGGSGCTKRTLRTAWEEDEMKTNKKKKM